MREPLSKKQSEVYEYIRDCITDKRYSPAGPEIAKALGYKNRCGSYYIIKRMIKKGWLSRNKEGLIMLGRDNWI